MHSNKKAKVQPISAGDVVIDTVANPADKAYCHGQVELPTVGADPHLPTLERHEANHPHKMVDAVKLKADTDFRCQDMTYHTTWFVHLEAIR
jgi:membrane protein YdbS with pleckstrin-like domain